MHVRKLTLKVAEAGNVNATTVPSLSIPAASRRQIPSRTVQALCGCMRPQVQVERERGEKCASAALTEDGDSNLQESQATKRIVSSPSEYPGACATR